MQLHGHVANHIKTLIARYKAPPDVADQAQNLGSTQGLELLASWVHEHGQRREVRAPLAKDVEALRRKIDIVSSEKEAEPSPPQRIKVYPELSRQLVIQKRDRELRLWYLARAHDIEGEGWITVKELIKEARAVNVSERSVRGLLRRGEGLFWQRVEDRLRIRGLESVSLTMECERGPGRRPVWVPFKEIDTLESFRASLYSSWFAVRDKQIISRSTLEGLWDRTRQTLSRWEEIAGIEVKKVLAYAAPRNLQTDPEIMAKYPDASRTWEEQTRGRVYEVWQLPNRYQSPLATAAQGMVRKVRRRCRRALLSVEGQRYQRLYFDSPHAVAKALEAGQVAFLHEGEHHGKTLYAFCAV